MSELVLGVDGGNTKTVALTARRDGTVVGVGRAGCADIYSAPSFDSAIAEIVGAVRQSLPKDSSADDVESAVFSLAGADWEEDKADLCSVLSEVVPRADVTVINDAIGAIRAGTADGIGVSVVVGTGGCIGAVGPGGRSWHSSWWALNTGAWAIGEDALHAVYKAELGLGPATRLTADALRLFGAEDVEDLLHGFTRRGGRNPWEAAQFAPAVLKNAKSGDRIAEEIIRQQGAMLGSFARIAAKKVGLEPPFPLVLLGGVLRGEGAELIVDSIVSSAASAEVVRPGREPVVGALLLALDQALATYDAAVVDATSPDAEVFATLPEVS